MMSRKRTIFVSCIQTLGWFALATLPSPWWRVIPVLIFTLPSVVSYAQNDQTEPTSRERTAGYAIAVVLVVAVAWAESTLTDVFGKQVLEQLVTSWQFALGGWSLSMLLIVFAMNKAKASGTWLT